MMPIHASVVHRLPGRVRLRFAEERGNPIFFSRLDEKFQDIEAVHGVKLNTATGSALLEFSGSAEALFSELRRHGIEVEGAQTQPPPRAPDFSPARPIRLVTGRNINAMFMLGSLLAVAGAAQTFRGKILMPSLSLFWSAMQAFRYSAERR